MWLLVFNQLKLGDKCGYPTRPWSIYFMFVNL